MSRIEEVKQNLSEKFPVGDFKFYYENDNDVVVVPKANILEVLKYYRENSFYDFLMDLTAVDYSKYPETQEGRYAVVYHLFSSKTLNRLRLKVFVQEEDAKLASATSVWRSANWFEREAYDMYGIVFEGHPNLTKILTHHHFKGHPLRKDYDANNQQHCSDVLPVHFDDGSRFSPVPGKDLVPLNIGPSHPATHGTLRVMAALDGEKVEKAGVELGFLHRCFEKMAETHPYNQVIPYTDRLNYCSAPMNNIGYCKAVEKMLGVEIPLKAQAIRIILAELSRVIDHIVCIGANAVDLGALSGFFYLFKLREQVYSLFEKLCGARLTVSMTRVGGMAQDPPAGWYKDVLETCKSLRKGIDEVDRLLTENKIWMQRTQGVGSISAEDAIMWGYTGPCLRAAGVGLDLRKAEPYYGYESLDFEVPVGTTGDVYDRYLVRLEEMKQSVKIVEQVAKNIPAGDYTIRDKSIVLPEKKDVYGNIEGLMNHFMLIMKGIKPPKGEIYDYTEAANGELGFFLVSDGEMKPYRLRVRPPCFAIYQSFPEQITGGLVADVISVLGSMNLIAGELDR
ncbi:MAG: NADH-quinone oxidoreductase subunit C [Bdellovibrionaceae bacterium]|nr:NADH-quinone oxidoreductase subunit C [Pseudobdellovibrionaceae bacterium]